MTVTVTLTNLANLQNQTTACTEINNNSAAIVTGFSDCLNTAGDTMSGNLDMNGNQILNQGATAYTVATLPVSPHAGQLATVSDGTAGLAWGATVTGGHSTFYLVWFNNSAWTVIGK